MSNKIKKLAVLGGAPTFDVPIYLTRPRVPSVEEVMPLISSMLESRWLTNNGVYVQELEKRLTEFMGVELCMPVVNGTMALDLSIKALELKGEVITTPFTFPATVHALHFNGITPVFCDIDQKTFNIDAKQIEQLITPRTTGIMPVHVFGNPCDVQAISDIARKHKIKVLYDAAHTFGVLLNGVQIGRFGDASVFSFHATKLFTTLEGGAIASNNREISTYVRLMANFGIQDEETVVRPGINAKMNELQAAFGILNMKNIQVSIQKRQERYKRYYKQLSVVPGISFQHMHPDSTQNHSYCVIRIDSERYGLTRDEVYTCLRKEQVLVRKYFSPLCSSYECYRSLPSAQKELLPNAYSVAESVLSLPLYDDLPLSVIDDIVKLIIHIQNNAQQIKEFLR